MEQQADEEGKGDELNQALCASLKLNVAEDLTDRFDPFDEKDEEDDPRESDGFLSVPSPTRRSSRADHPQPIASEDYRALRTGIHSLRTEFEAGPEEAVVPLSSPPAIIPVIPLFKLDPPLYAKNHSTPSPLSPPGTAFLGHHWIASENPAGHARQLQIRSQPGRFPCFFS